MQSTTEIKIIHQPTQEQLNQLGVSKWPIWAKEVSEFPWTYEETETCYLLEGDVIVTPVNGQPVQLTYSPVKRCCDGGFSQNRLPELLAQRDDLNLQHLY